MRACLVWGGTDFSPTRKGDRAKGRIGNVVAAVTGDEDKQEDYKRQHDQGKAKEKETEEELRRQHR